MKILRRNLSLMLAVRYLNPLRTMFSIITLICLGGVALGVMVLIVVLSVMEGLQKEMEEKGFALQPHYTAAISHAVTGGALPITMEDCDWPEIAQQLRKHPKVSSVYAKLEGIGLAQTDNYQNATLSFNSVEVDNAAHINPLKSMIVNGTFDLGMDNKCVISHSVAKRYHLSPGSRMTLTPVSGNIEQMASILQRIEGEMLTHTTPQFMPAMQQVFEGAEITEDGLILNDERYKQALTALLPFVDMPESSRWAEYCLLTEKETLTDEEKKSLRSITRKLRQSEADLCLELYLILSAGRHQTTDEKERWNQIVESIATLDRDRENGKEIENLRSLVVPVDLEIVGIYQTPENMPGPDLYLPLHVAQEAVGYTGNNIMGLCVRLKDAHDPGDLASAMAALIQQYKAPLIIEDSTADMPPPIEEVDYDNLSEETEITEEEESADLTSATSVQETDESEPEEASDVPVIDVSEKVWTITPWKDALAAWYELIANERVMLNFVLSAITLIASFCIMAVMFTMSLQRKREIAVLQALGATPGKIVGIFAWQGLIIGLTGAILGVLLALLVLHYRIEIQGALASVGLDPFPIEAHGISLPAVYKAEIFIKQAVIAFIMVSVASIIPSLFISRQDPAKALRSN